MIKFSRLKNELLSIPGWNSRRKIVVIESDDWGSIRMPSKAAFTRLATAGLDLGPAGSLHFNKYDTLASADDMEALFEVLGRHRDKNRRKPVITALCLVANPHFEKIEASRFGSYAYELITDTFEKYYPNGNVWSLWRQGASDGLFAPQFHGREHLNVRQWLKALANNDQQTRLAFNEGMWGFNNAGISYQAAFDFLATDELEDHRSILDDGLRCFEQLFGYRASFFVPPNGLLSEQLYNHVSEKGIRYIYSSRNHQLPIGNGNYERRLNYLGKQNSSGQRFITRNAFFEPSLTGKDSVSTCLRDVETAFRWNKPAIISSHRVNFIGELEETNRTQGLRLLDELLSGLTRRWPEVEFMTTPELGQLMSSG